MKRIIFIVIFCAFTLVSLTLGCDATKPKPEREEINFRVGTSGIFSGSTSYGTLLINNHSQLKENYEGQSIQWVDDIPIWERYCSDFFNENALVMYTFGDSGDNAPEYEVERLVKEGKTLTVYIIQHGMTQGLMYFSITILIEVNKYDVLNVQNIETITRIIYDEDGGN